MAANRLSDALLQKRTERQKTADIWEGTLSQRERRTQQFLFHFVSPLVRCNEVKADVDVGR